MWDTWNLRVTMPNTHTSPNPLLLAPKSQVPNYWLYGPLGANMLDKSWITRSLGLRFVSLSTSGRLCGLRSHAVMPTRTFRELTHQNIWGLRVEGLRIQGHQTPNETCKSNLSIHQHGCTWVRKKPAALGLSFPASPI